MARLSRQDSVYGCIGCLGIIGLVVALCSGVIWLGSLDSFEETVWYNAKHENTEAGYERFLKRYPAGKYATEAQQRIDQLAVLCPGTKIKWEKVAEIMLCSEFSVEHWQIKGDVKSSDWYVKVKDTDGSEHKLPENALGLPFFENTYARTQQAWLELVKSRAPHAIMSTVLMESESYRDSAKNDVFKTQIYPVPSPPSQ